MEIVECIPPSTELELEEEVAPMMIEEPSLPKK